MNFIGKIFKRKKDTYRRAHVKNVNPGDVFVIEWEKSATGITTVVCLNNDPDRNKIFIQIKWLNYKEFGILPYEQIILDYGDKRLKNFHLLNSVDFVNIDSTEKKEESVDSLKLKLQDAVENEDFELAHAIQKEIDKISNRSV